MAKEITILLSMVKYMDQKFKLCLEKTTQTLLSIYVQMSSKQFEYKLTFANIQEVSVRSTETAAKLIRMINPAYLQINGELNSLI